ncbi:MAG TPA: class I SAM-dependent methyltransferase [Methylomirabilota bacterium]|nr:class I SAM-dependent methyltransferase [Methylomirabilota bacterium]
MARTPRSYTAHAGWSAISGRIRVVDYRRERRLIVSGAILSAYPLDGDWSTIEREYWWQGVARVRFPPHPRVLLVGLGGGTQAHLVHRLTTPRLITAIERDEVIIDVARRWFGLADLGPMEFYCGDAETTARALADAGRRFDFVMEDAAYADVYGRSRAVVEAVVPLVARGGTLVVNRHRRGDAGSLARRLRSRFESVRLHRVRREGENVLLFAERPLR